MPRKSEEAPKEGVNMKLAEAIRDSASRIWLAGVGAFAAAQQQGSGAFDSLVVEGERVQKQVKHAADDAYASVVTKASQAWDQLSHDQLGRLFEDSVARALHVLSIPTREDVDKLSQRVAELTKILKTLLQETEAQDAVPALTRQASAPEPRAEWHGSGRREPRRRYERGARRRVDADIRRRFGLPAGGSLLRHGDRIGDSIVGMRKALAAEVGSAVARPPRLEPDYDTPHRIGARRHLRFAEYRRFSKKGVPWPGSDTESPRRRSRERQ